MNRFTWKRRFDYGGGHSNFAAPPCLCECAKVDDVTGLVPLSHRWFPCSAALQKGFRSHAYLEKWVALLSVDAMASSIAMSCFKLTLNNTKFSHLDRFCSAWTGLSLKLTLTLIF